jgi:hypothetical protein
LLYQIADLALAEDPRRFAGERPADQFSKAEIEAMWRALRRNAKLDKRRALNREAWRLLEAAAD